MTHATKRLKAALALMLALGLISPVASAKPKAKAPKATQSAGVVTQTDVRICIGENGSTPSDQIAACTKIIKSGKIKHPHEGDYYATRAAAYFAINELDNAVADLDKAVSFTPTPEIYFQRALVQMAKNNADAAKADLAQVMKSKPDFAPSYFMRGLISYRSADYAEAVTYFDNAVQHVPTYYQALFARGVAKKKAGDQDGGAKDVKDARGMSSHVDEDLKQVGVVP